MMVGRLQQIKLNLPVFIEYLLANFAAFTTYSDMFKNSVAFLNHLVFTTPFIVAFLSMYGMP